MRRKYQSWICVLIALLLCTVIGLVRKNEETAIDNTPITTVDTSEERKVYKTPTGKRYHYSPRCGGVNSTAVDIDIAISFGLSPCEKCVH